MNRVKEQIMGGESFEEILADLIFVYPESHQESIDDYDISCCDSSYLFVACGICVFLMLMGLHKNYFSRNLKDIRNIKALSGENNKQEVNFSRFIKMDVQSIRKLQNRIPVCTKSCFILESKFTPVNLNIQTESNDPIHLAIKPPKIGSQMLRINRLTPQEVLQTRCLSTFKVKESLKPAQLSHSRAISEAKISYNSERSSLSEVISTSQTISARFTHSVSSSEKSFTRKLFGKKTSNKELLFNRQYHIPKHLTIAPPSLLVEKSGGEFSLYSFQEGLHSPENLEPSTQSADIMISQGDELMNSNKRSRDAKFDGKFPLFLTFYSSYSHALRGTPKMRSRFSRSNSRKKHSSFANTFNQFRLSEEDRCDQVITKVGDVSSNLSVVSQKVPNMLSQVSDLPQKMPCVVSQMSDLSQKVPCVPPKMSDLSQKVSCLSSQISYFPQKVSCVSPQMSDFPQKASFMSLKKDDLSKVPDILIQNSTARLRKIRSKRSGNGLKTGTSFHVENQYQNLRNASKLVTMKKRVMAHNYGSSLHLSSRNRKGEHLDSNSHFKLAKGGEKCVLNNFKFTGKAAFSNPSNEILSSVARRDNSATRDETGWSKDTVMPHRQHLTANQENLSLQDGIRKYNDSNKITVRKLQTNPTKINTALKTIFLKKINSYDLAVNKDMFLNLKKTENSKYNIKDKNSISKEHICSNHSSSTMGMALPFLKENIEQGEKRKEFDKLFFKSLAKPSISLGNSNPRAGTSVGRSDSIHMIESLPSVHETDATDISDMLAFADSSIYLSLVSMNDKPINKPVTSVAGKGIATSLVNTNLVDICKEQLEKSAECNPNVESTTEHCQRNDTATVLTGFGRVNGAMKSLSQSYKEDVRVSKTKIEEAHCDKINTVDINNYPMVLDNLIRNSKDYIQNTRLLCKSAKTTVYEKLSVMNPQGPGCVRASKMRSAAIQFPTLTSFLDQIEKEDQESNAYLNCKKSVQDRPGRKKLEQHAFEGSLTKKECLSSEDHDRFDIGRYDLNKRETKIPQNGSNFDSTSSLKQTLSSEQNQKEGLILDALHFGTSEFDTHSNSLESKKFLKERKEPLDSHGAITAKRNFMLRKNALQQKTVPLLTKSKQVTEFRKVKMVDFRHWKKDALKNIKKNLSEKVNGQKMTRICKTMSPIIENSEPAVEKDQHQNLQNFTTKHKKNTKRKLISSISPEIQHSVFATPDPTRGSENLVNKESTDKDLNATFQVLDGHSTIIECEIEKPETVPASIAHTEHYQCLIHESFGNKSKSPKALSEYKISRFAGGKNCIAKMSPSGDIHCTAEVNNKIKLCSQNGTIGVITKSKFSKDTINDILPDGSIYTTENTSLAVRKCEHKFDTSNIQENYSNLSVNTDINKVCKNDKDNDLSISQSVIFSDINATSWTRNINVDHQDNVILKTMFQKMARYDLVAPILKSHSETQQPMLHNMSVKKFATIPGTYFDTCSLQSPAVPKSTKIFSPVKRQKVQQGNKSGSDLLQSTKHHQKHETTSSPKNVSKLMGLDGDHSCLSVESDGRLKVTVSQTKPTTSPQTTCPSYTSKHKAADNKSKDLQSHWQGTVAFRKRLQHLLQNSKSLQRHQNIQQQNKQNIPNEVNGQCSQAKTEDNLYKVSKTVRNKYSILHKPSNKKPNAIKSKKTGNGRFSTNTAPLLTKCKMQNKCKKTKVNGKTVKTNNSVKLVTNKTVNEKCRQRDRLFPTSKQNVIAQSSHKPNLTHTGVFGQSTNLHVKRFKEEIKHKLQQAHFNCETNNVSEVVEVPIKPSPTPATEFGTSDVSAVNKKKVYKSGSHLSWSKVKTDKCKNKQLHSIPNADRIMSPDTRIKSEQRNVITPATNSPCRKPCVSHHKSSSERSIPKKVTARRRKYSSVDNFNKYGSSSSNLERIDIHQYVPHYDFVSENADVDIEVFESSTTEHSTNLTGFTEAKNTFQQLLDKIKENYFLSMMARRNESIGNTASPTVLDNKHNVTVKENKSDISSNLSQSKQFILHQFIEGASDVLEKTRSNPVSDKEVCVNDEHHSHSSGTGETSCVITHADVSHCFGNQDNDNETNKENKDKDVSLALNRNDKIEVIHKNNSLTIIHDQDSKCVFENNSTHGKPVLSKTKTMQRKIWQNSVGSQNVQVISKQEMNSNTAEEKDKNIGSYVELVPFELKNQLCPVTLAGNMVASLEGNMNFPIKVACTNTSDVKTEMCDQYISQNNLLESSSRLTNMMHHTNDTLEKVRKNPDNLLIQSSDVEKQQSATKGSRIDTCNAQKSTSDDSNEQFLLRSCMQDQIVHQSSDNISQTNSQAVIVGKRNLEMYSIPEESDYESGHNVPCNDITHDAVSILPSIQEKTVTSHKDDTFDRVNTLFETNVIPEIERNESDAESMKLVKAETGKKNDQSFVVKINSAAVDVNIDNHFDKLHDILECSYKTFTAVKNHATEIAEKCDTSPKILKEKHSLDDGPICSASFHSKDFVATKNVDDLCPGSQHVFSDVIKRVTDVKHKDKSVIFKDEGGQLADHEICDKKAHIISHSKIPDDDTENTKIKCKSSKRKEILSKEVAEFELKHEKEGPSIYHNTGIDNTSSEINVTFARQSGSKGTLLSSNPTTQTRATGLHEEISTQINLDFMTKIETARQPALAERTDNICDNADTSQEMLRAQVSHELSQHNIKNPKSEETTLTNKLHVDEEESVQERDENFKASNDVIEQARKMSWTTDENIEITEQKIIKEQFDVKSSKLTIDNDKYDQCSSNTISEIIKKVIALLKTSSVSPCRVDNHSTYLLQDSAECSSKSVHKVKSIETCTLENTKHSSQNASIDRGVSGVQIVEEIDAVPAVKHSLFCGDISRVQTSVDLQVDDSTERTVESTVTNISINKVTSAADEPRSDNERLEHIAEPENIWQSDRKGDTENVVCFDKNTVVQTQEQNLNNTLNSNRGHVKKEHTKSFQDKYMTTKKMERTVNNLNDDLESLLNKELSLVSIAGSHRQGCKTNQLFGGTNGQAAQRRKKKRWAHKSSSQSSGHHKLHSHFQRENSGSLICISSNTSQITYSPSDMTMHCSSRHVRPLMSSKRFAKLEEFLQKVEMVNRTETTSKAKDLSKLISLTSLTASSQEEVQLPLLLYQTTPVCKVNDLKQTVSEVSEHKCQVVSKVDTASLVSSKHSCRTEEKLQKNHHGQLDYTSENNQEKNSSKISHINFTYKDGQLEDQMSCQTVHKLNVTDINSVMSGRLDTTISGNKMEVTVTTAHDRDINEPEVCSKTLHVATADNTSERDDVHQRAIIEKESSMFNATQAQDRDISSVNSSPVILESQESTKPLVSAWIPQTVEESSILSTSSSSIVLSWIDSDVTDVEETILNSPDITEHYSNIHADASQSGGSHPLSPLSNKSMKLAKAHQASDKVLYPVPGVCYTEISTAAATNDAHNSVSVEATLNNISDTAKKNIKGISSRNIWETGRQSFSLDDHENFNKEIHQTCAPSLNEEALVTDSHEKHYSASNNLQPTLTEDVKCVNFSLGLHLETTEKKQVHIFPASNKHPEERSSTLDQPSYFSTFLQVPTWNPSFDVKNDQNNIDLDKQSAFIGNYVQSAWTNQSTRNTSLSMISPHKDQHGSNSSIHLFSMNQPFQNHDSSLPYVSCIPSNMKSSEDLQSANCIPKFSNSQSLQTTNRPTAKDTFTFRNPLSNSAFVHTKQENKQTEDKKQLNFDVGGQEKQSSLLRKVHFDNKSETSDKSSSEHLGAESRPSKSYLVTKDKSKEKVTLDEHPKTLLKSKTMSFKDKCNYKQNSKISDATKIKRNKTLEQHLCLTLDSGTNMRSKCNAAPSVSDNGTAQSTSSHASLNWYKPQSLPSSTSVNNGNTSSHQKEKFCFPRSQLCEPDTTHGDNHGNTIHTHSQASSQRFTAGNIPSQKLAPSSLRTINGKVSVQRSLKFVHVTHSDTLSKTLTADQESKWSESISTYSSISEHNTNKHQHPGLRHLKESVTSTSKRQTLPPPTSGNSRIKGSKASHDVITASVSSKDESKHSLTFEGGASSKQSQKLTSNSEKSADSLITKRSRTSANSFQKLDIINTKRTSQVDSLPVSAIKTPHTSVKNKPNQPPYHSRGYGKLQVPDTIRTQSNQSVSPVTADLVMPKPHTSQQKDPTDSSPLRSSKLVSRLVEMFERKLEG